MKPLLSNSGLRLGVGTALLSSALDQEQSTFPPSELYTEAVYTSLFNLLILGPFIHARLTRFLTSKKSALRTVWDILSLTAIHSTLYSWVHRGMHKITSWRPIHKFHHKYKQNVVPTVANAVSASEFLVAYMFPFIVGTVLLAPTQFALCASVSIISVSNLVVHSNNLKYKKWNPLFVSPNKHLNHHFSKAPFYSAPLYDWGYVRSKFCSVFK